MLFIRRIRKDNCLKEFVSYCKEKYGDNLVAIVIYGSYAWGYFDKEKSDYDIFVILKERVEESKKLAQKRITRKFPKVSLQYFCSMDNLLFKVREGHWSIYITLLKSARAIYATREYRWFLRELRKMDFVKEVFNLAAMEYKAKFEKDALRKVKGYKAAKWALPSVRKRLQLLTYIRRGRTVWNLKKIVRLNKDILTKEEGKFLMELDKKVRMRSEKFGKKDEGIVIRILDKLIYELLAKELGSIVK